MTKVTQATDVRVQKPWRQYMLALFSALLVLAAMAITVRGSQADEAAQAAEAATFVRGFSDQALATLSDETLDEEAQAREFRRLLTTGFQLDLIGRFVLGRHWRKASKSERAEFTQLFEDYIVASYSRQLSGFSGEQLVIEGGRPKGKSGALVASRLVRPEGEPYHVEWRLRRGKAGWKIIDVVVEGVSMAVTHRSEFGSVISEQGGELGGLLEVLREKTDRPQIQASAGHADTL